MPFHYIVLRRIINYLNRGAANRFGNKHPDLSAHND